MKVLPAALQAHLDSGTTTLAWCWRVERSDGLVFGFTEHDRPLEFDGTSYEPESGFTTSEIRANMDLSVDAQEAQGALRSDRITETDILDGRWDNAAIEVWRVNWAAPEQRVLMRRGNIGQVRRGNAAFVAEIRSLAHVLNQPVGRTYQYYRQLHAALRLARWLRPPRCAGRLALDLRPGLSRGEYRGRRGLRLVLCQRRRSGGPGSHHDHRWGREQTLGIPL